MTADGVQLVIDRMRQQLQAYSPGAEVASLHGIVTRLSGALEALYGTVDDEWLAELRSAWWPLEYVNARVLGDERQLLTSSEVKEVVEYRDEFIALLTRY